MNSLAYFRKAFGLDLRGMDEEALETYEKARSLRPLHTNILFNLGVMYEDAGKYRKAIQCYRTILEGDPNHIRAKLFLADAEASRSMVYDEEEEKEQDKLLQVLNTPITDFELSVRSRNCLAKMNIKTLGDLSRKTETELLSYKNFGETSLAEIKALLSSKNLSLGMSSDDFFKVEDAEEIEDTGFIDEEEDKPDLLDTPLNAVNFSVRCRRAFEKLGIRTLGELAATKEAEFHGLRNFGQTSLSELKGKLAEYGLALDSG
jgi:DNA-directed RNA polymerase subunit alpha